MKFLLLTTYYNDPTNSYQLRLTLKLITKKLSLPNRPTFFRGRDESNVFFCLQLKRSRGFVSFLRTLCFEKNWAVIVQDGGLKAY